jgi:hypothetical protein
MTWPVQLRGALRRDMCSCEGGGDEACAAARGGGDEACVAVRGVAMRHVWLQWGWRHGPCDCKGAAMWPVQLRGVLRQDVCGCKGGSDEAHAAAMHMATRRVWLRGMRPYGMCDWEGVGDIAMQLRGACGWEGDGDGAHAAGRGVATWHVQLHGKLRQ